MTEPSTLYTIGHSSRTIEEFGELLIQNGITAIADVRSHPASRRFPWFNRPTLQTGLQRFGCEYVFLGRELGARREEAECYLDGIARYERIRETELFRFGLERLRKGCCTHTIALMCAEKDPVSCHRAILVCRSLRQEVLIQHIHDSSLVESHAAMEKRLLAMHDLILDDLFDEPDELVSHAYKLQGERIAYRRNVPEALLPNE